MTSKSKGMSLMLLAGILMASAVLVATAGQKAPAARPAPPTPPAVAATPEPGEEFFFIEDGRAWLGVTLSDINAEKARELKLSGEYGALVESVVDDSPAAKAGVQEGDVITGFGGERVRSVAHLTRLVRETPAGRKASLEVVRGGQSQTLDVSLEARRMHFAMPEIAVAPRVHVSPRVEAAPMPRFDIEMQPGPGGLMVWSRGPRLGITGDEISGQLAEYFGVKQGQGVLVREVLAGSAAEKAGLKAGDVIVRINDDAVNDVGDLRQALSEAESKEVTVTIIREHREQTLKVTLDEPQRRTPRRSAWMDELRWEQPSEEQERALQAQLEALEQQAQGQVQDEVQEQMRLLEEQLREHGRQYEQQLKQQFDSQEFQKKMREFELQYREMKRKGEVI